MNTIQPKSSITLCGFMACGKTTLGKALAAQLCFDFADTDDMLLRETGMTIAQMFACGGEAYFRDREHEIVRKASSLQRSVISTGGGVMTFERNAKLLARHTAVIYIHRSFDACCQAVRARENRPLSGSKSREELQQMYDVRIAAYKKYADFTLFNDGTLQDALSALVPAARSLLSDESLRAL